MNDILVWVLAPVLSIVSGIAIPAIYCEEPSMFVPVLIFFWITSFITIIKNFQAAATITFLVLLALLFSTLDGNPIGFEGKYAELDWVYAVVMFATVIAFAYRMLFPSKVQL